MRLFSTAFLLILATSLPVQARLGETAQQCQKRYGDPVEESESVAGPIKVYHKSGFKVEIG